MNDIFTYPFDAAEIMKKHDCFFAERIYKK